MPGAAALKQGSTVERLGIVDEEQSLASAFKTVPCKLVIVSRLLLFRGNSRNAGIAPLAMPQWTKSGPSTAHLRTPRCSELTGI
jgi:hypothetical protein